MGLPRFTPSDSLKIKRTRLCGSLKMSIHLQLPRLAGDTRCSPYLAIRDYHSGIAPRPLAFSCPDFPPRTKKAPDSKKYDNYRDPNRNEHLQSDLQILLRFESVSILCLLSAE